MASVLEAGGSRYFYPRSPCGERPLTPARISSRLPISIHALLAESDFGGRVCQRNKFRFLSTLSLRRATMGGHEKPFRGDFYPRSPCGERHDLEPSTTRRLTFLSTLSLRRATWSVNNPPSSYTISIHALLAESDEPENPIIAYDNDFYPRSPCGERPGAVILILCPVTISIHALLAESDGY